MPKDMDRHRMLSLIMGCSMSPLYRNQRCGKQLEGMYLLLRDKILNHRNVLPYRTQELSVQLSEHTPVSVDGRLLNGTPVGTFTIGVEKEVINFLIPD